jgi:hypothetical protein
MRVALITGLYALLFGQVIRAQATQKIPESCAPSCLSADEFNETVAKKVYPKIIVDDVKFDSQGGMPDSSKEAEVISELKQHMFDAGSDGLDEVLEIGIRGAWQDLGYFKVEATGQLQVVSTDSTYEHVLVTIRVNRGLQYRLGDVRFRVLDEDESLAFAREELRKLIPLQDGDLFDVEKIRQSLDALRSLYDSNGYIEFVATPETEVDDNTQRISLAMELQQSKQFHVGTVEVFGLKPRKAAVLTAALKAGDVFNRRIVDEFVAANMPDLPKGTSSHVLGMHKDFKKATVDIVVDFRAWPQQREF